MQRRIILGTALSFLIAMMILATEGLTGQLDQTVQALQGTASFVPTSWLYLPLVQKSGWNTLLNETFEGGFPGSWQVTSNNSYYWNKRSCRAYAGSYSAWAASGSSYSCGSNYPNSTETWMVYGPVSLASTSAANLSFQVWQNSESGKDKFYVLTSLDDNYYYGWSYSGYSSGWVNLTFDLTNWGSLGNLTGQPNVWLAFVFLTDSANTYAEGVYVDNVVLNASYPGTSAPSLAEQPKVDIPEGWIASSEQLHRQLTPQGQR